MNCNFSKKEKKSKNYKGLLYRGRPDSLCLSIDLLH